jgi:hypothetical protein
MDKEQARKAIADSIRVKINELNDLLPGAFELGLNVTLNLEMIASGVTLYVPRVFEHKERDIDY